jgi:hypothetical protein
VIVLRRTCTTLLVVAALLAWADLDTTGLAVTRFSLVVLAVAAIGLVAAHLADGGADGGASVDDQLERDVIGRPAR